jgi:hypothetical protein
VWERARCVRKKDQPLPRHAGEWLWLNVQVTHRGATERLKCRVEGRIHKNCYCGNSFGWGGFWIQAKMHRSYIPGLEGWWKIFSKGMPRSMLQFLKMPVRAQRIGVGEKNCTVGKLLRKPRKSL